MLRARGDHPDGVRSGSGPWKRRAGGEESREGRSPILAASSLTDAFGQLGKTFEQQDPGTTVKTSLGASSDLLAQIQQGAPADVFASAAEEEMNTAVKDDLVAVSPWSSSRIARSSWSQKTTLRT